MKKGICGHPRQQQDETPPVLDASQKQSASPHHATLGSMRMGARKAGGVTRPPVTHVFHPKPPEPLVLFEHGF